jgi:hypothetical protein
MAKKFLTGLNLVVLPSDPISGSEGELYFNSSASVAKIYQAGVWSVLGAGAGGGTTVSTTEPESPETGDSWYKNDTGEFYVYDGTYWVEVNGVVGLTEEQVQDYVSPLFIHNNHTNITATYDDVNNEILLEGASTVSGSLSNIDSISSPDFIQFDTTANVTPVTGLLGWDSVEGTLNLGLSSNKHIHVGEESVYRVRNSTGSTISKGTALYASGVEASGRIQVTPYVADGSVREVRFMGLATESINNGVNGFVQHFGYVRDLDTRGTSSTAISVGDETWAAGDILYVHPTVPGKLTNIKPTHAIVVAIIIIRHQTTGILFVRPSSGGHLEDIHDISISGSVQNNELLSYDLSNGVWINRTAEEAGLLTELSASTTYLSQTDATYSFEPLNAKLSNLSSLEVSAGFLVSDGIDGWNIDENEYLTTANASSLYLTEVEAATTYLSQTTAASAYQPIGEYLTGEDLNGYLTESSASVIYQPFGDYLIGDDLNGYLTESSASTIYLTQSDAVISYQPLNSDLTFITSASSTGFLKSIGGSWSIDENSYLTNSSASEIFLSQSNAASTYLTTSNAALTYAPLSNPTFTGTVSLPSTTSIGDVSSTEIGYVNGVTSSIQTQIDSKSPTSHNHDGTYQPADGDLSAIAAITSGVGLLKRLSSDTWTIDTASYITGSSPTISTSVLAGTSTFNLINSTATTVNFAGAATSLTIGSNDPVATTTLRTPTILTTSSSLDLFNTVATTLNFAGATTSLTIGGTPTGATSVTLFGNTTGSGSTKTINIGTGGASGSNTEINIGSSTSGATGTVSVYPSTVFNGAVSVPTPTSSTHAANKSYVDSLASGINIKTEVVYVSQQALNATYVNGTSDSSGGLGVGATLTGAVDGALILDGDEVQSNQRVLIRNQADQKQNGIYIVSFPGDGDDPFILTRAADFNGASATSGLIKSGDYVLVTSGSVAANDSYVVSQGGTSTNPSGAIKVGTDNIVMAQYSGVPSNISTLGYVTVGTWAATPIDKDYIDIGIARANNPVFTGHVTIPSPVDDSDAASKEYVDDLIFASLPYLPDIVPLDDMRYEFDGINSRFLPKFAGEQIDINNPLRLLLTINGIIQVVDFPEYVWQSMLPREGFMVDSDGYIAYSEVPPVGSTFDARLMLGPNVNSIKKGYPFKAVDILLGA